MLRRRAHSVSSVWNKIALDFICGSVLVPSRCHCIICLSSKIMSENRTRQIRSGGHKTANLPEFSQLSWSNRDCNSGLRAQVVRVLGARCTRHRVEKSPLTQVFAADGMFCSPAKFPRVLRAFVLNAVFLAEVMQLCRGHYTLTLFSRRFSRTTR